MRNDLIPPNSQVLERLGIDSSIIRLGTRLERANYRAIINWFTNYKPLSNSNLELLKVYIESSHHLCEISAWDKAGILLRIRLNNGEEFHDQLGIWGNYSEQIQLYERLVGKLNIELDAICLNGLGNSYLEQGYYQRSIHYFNHLLEITVQNSLPELEIKSLGGLGKAYLNVGNCEEAANYHNRQLKAAQRNSYKKGECFALLGFGDI
jgi:tetratricopeptide (TPR) repeat protein